jgi:class 3 adenylate cyclase
MGHVTRKNLNDPDEIRDFPLLALQLTKVGPLTVGRGRLEPGFRWSTHVGAATGQSVCQLHHLQLLVSGRFAVQMDDGEITEIVPDDIFDVPPGHDVWVVGDEPVVVIDFLGNIPQLGLPTERDRVVTTLVMTDIVDSTATASRVGDVAWKQLLADHNRVIRGRLETFRGQEVNTTGDGFVAMFASAQSALRAAIAMRDAVQELGIEIRVGVHTGEVELLPGDIGGVAVHAAARVMSLGGPSEVIVSSSTRDMADGSGLAFEDLGAHDLKGLDRPLTVYRLVG